jgi:predicted RNA-binding Zn-ribbon protein involved in translation (DUF1610 family)
MEDPASDIRETGELRPMSCPKCGSTDVRRAKSEGVVVMFFQIFGRFPFRCRSCRVRFYRYAPPPEDP